MSNGIGLAIAALVLVIAVVIVRSVRMVLFEVDPKRTRGRGLRRDEASRLTERLKSLDVRCPRCREESFLVLGSTDRYKCERCRHEFTGPSHPKLTDG